MDRLSNSESQGFDKVEYEQDKDDSPEKQARHRVACDMGAEHDPRRQPIDEAAFAKEMEILRRELSQQMQRIVRYEFRFIERKCKSLPAKRLKKFQSSPARIEHEGDDGEEEDDGELAEHSMTRKRIRTLPTLAPNIRSHSAVSFERESHTREDEDLLDDPSGWVNVSRHSSPTNTRSNEGKNLHRTKRSNTAQDAVQSVRSLKLGRSATLPGKNAIGLHQLPKMQNDCYLGVHPQFSRDDGSEPFLSEGSAATTPYIDRIVSTATTRRIVRPCRSHTVASQHTNSETEQWLGPSAVVPANPTMEIRRHLPPSLTSTPSQQLLRLRRSATFLGMLANRPWRAKVRKLVHSDWFDAWSAVLVVLNALTIGLQADHMAKNVLEKPSSGFRVVESCFCFLFSLELVLRFVAFGWKFFCGTDWLWNTFDFFLVGMQVVDEVLSYLETSNRSLNFSFMRVLRILRLIRVLRVIRVLRLIGELRTIVSSIAGSLKSLLWTTILIFLFVYVVAVYFTQLVLDFRVSMRGEAESPHDEQLRRYFGSMGRSIFTLYEAISGGIDWDTIAEPLMGRISVLLGFVLAGYTAFCLLALMNVVTGVFVQAALDSAKQDRTSYMLRHVRELFSHADPDHTGRINWEQFQSRLDEDYMQEFFKVIDVDRSDAKSVFALLDANDSGEINLEEFLNGCLGLHGPAKALHLATLMYQSRISAHYQAVEMEHIYKHLQCIVQAIPALAHQTMPLKPEMDAEILRRKSFQHATEARDDVSQNYDEVETVSPQLPHVLMHPLMTGEQQEPSSQVIEELS